MNDLSRLTLNRRDCLATITAATVMTFGGDPCSADVTAPSSPAAPRYDEPKTTLWRFGVRINTNVTLVSGVATFPVVGNWPEQGVTLLNRNVDGRVSHLEFRDLPEMPRSRRKPANDANGGQNAGRQSRGAVQVAMAIPRLTSNSKFETTMEYRISKRNTLPPEDTSALVIPKRIDRELRQYTGNSPNIDATHIKIRALSRELDAMPAENAWERVRLIYDTVREKVRYVEGPIRNASDALADGKGDCEDMTSLFVALCRNAGIPARMVWIPGHCYPEFYLEDSAAGDGPAGYWYPCQAAGSELFGTMIEDRPIIQKGDRFTTPENRKPQRYVAEFFRCDRLGNGSPSYHFIREKVTTEGSP